jgi:hypothetical protein
VSAWLDDNAWFALGLLVGWMAAGLSAVVWLTIIEHRWNRPPPPEDPDAWVDHELLVQGLMMSDDHDWGRQFEEERQADLDYEIEVARIMSEQERDEARRRER